MERAKHIHSESTQGHFEGTDKSMTQDTKRSESLKQSSGLTQVSSDCPWQQAMQTYFWYDYPCGKASTKHLMAIVKLELFLSKPNTIPAILSATGKRRVLSRSWTCVSILIRF